MPFDGNGTYNPPAPQFPAVSGQVIYASDFNTIINDIAAALTDCIAKDGQTGVTANIDFGGNRIVNLAPGVAGTDAVTKAQAFTNPTFTTTTAEGMVIAGTGFTVTVTNADFTATALHVALQAEGNDSDLASSTAFVQRAVATAVAALEAGSIATLQDALLAEEAARIAADNLLAPLNSPALTGTPTATEPSVDDDTARIATCHFVNQQAFQAALPNQTGKAGQLLFTDGEEAYWEELASSGDVWFSMRTLPAERWLPCDGSVYAAADYPDLFQIIVSKQGVYPELAGTLLPSASAQIDFSPEGEYVAFGSAFLKIGTYLDGVYTELYSASSGVGATASGLVVSTDGDYVFITGTGKSILKRSGNTYATITAPSTATGTHYTPAINTDASVVVFVLNDSSALRAYVFTRSGDVFTAGSISPAPAASYGASMTDDGQYLAIAQVAFPYIRVYKASAPGVYAGLTAPPSSPASAMNYVLFSPDGEYLFAAYNSIEPFVVWKRTGDSFTKITGIPQPTSPGRSISLADGGNIAVTHGVPSQITMYKLEQGKVRAAPSLATTSDLTSAGAALQPASAGGRLLFGTTTATNVYLTGADVTTFPVPNITAIGEYSQVKGFIRK